VAALHKAAHNLKSENCFGEHLFSSKNCSFCFDVYGTEDAANAFSIGDCKDVYSTFSAGWPSCELIYMCAVVRGSTNCAYCSYCWYCENSRYCDSCVNCRNCFGCVGLRNKSYCIFNVQYGASEYEKLVKKLVGHMREYEEWGEFFPPQLSPFAYNESCAQDFLPLVESEARRMGWDWIKRNESEYKKASLVSLPDNLSGVDDSILKELLACQNCGKNYKLIKQELNHYRSMGLPLPRDCPECRHKKRFAWRNPLALYQRRCSICSQQVATSYAPASLESIACDACFLESIA